MKVGALDKLPVSQTNNDDRKTEEEGVREKVYSLVVHLGFKIEGFFDGG